MATMKSYEIRGRRSVENGDGFEDYVETVGIGWGIGNEIRTMDAVGELGLDEDVIDWILKQAADGDKEATFEFDCDNWLTIDMPDMINILLELSTKVDTVKRPYDEETVCPECGYDSFVIKPIDVTDGVESCLCDECGHRFLGVY